jgi:dTDP-4-amino-4,6-dideoxygalactose transaminase
MTYTIPLFDLHYDHDESVAVRKILDSKWISMGPQVKAVEDEFAKHLNIKYTVTVSNCTAALHLALLILGIGDGDEVIVPSLTFVATANAVRYVGATPVFSDVTSLTDFSLDPDDIKSKITNKTKAIIPMHYGGFACDIETIMSVASYSDLYVIEDAAHAPDSDYKKEKLGTIGDIGCFSFFSNKNITCAEGGILATNNEEYAHKARLLRSHGMTSLSFDRAKGHATAYDVIELGYNYRMDDIRGALLLSQLEKLKADTERRAYLRSVYCDNLKDNKNVTIPYKNYHGRTSNYIFPILLKDSTVKKRDYVRDQLKQRGIETSVHYPAVHRFSIYRQWSVDLPKTDYITDNEITLPLFYNLQEEEIAYVSSALKQII